MLKWTLLGVVVGCLGLADYGINRLSLPPQVVIHKLSILVLVAAGACGLVMLSILVMKKLGFIGGKSEHSKLSS